MIVFENHVGRLLEARLVPPVTMEEVSEFDRRRHRVTTTTMRERITCIDFSRGHVLASDVIEALIAAVRRPGPPSVRSALLLPPSNATLTLQGNRLMRDSPNPDRRTFTDKAELIKWVGEVLEPLELARLRQFLAE